VVKMLHPAGWGGWAFAVSGYDAADDVMNFSTGGHQEARGNNGCGQMFVENVREELDVQGEYFYDADTRELMVFPPAGMSIAQLQNATVEAPLLRTLVSIEGSKEAPVTAISMSGFNMTHAAYTYLESYEVPSGGDWSVHRGAAVFVQGAENVSLTQIKFDQLEGNGVFFSNHVKHSVISDNDFWRTGDSCILAVGSSRLNNGSASEYPSHNLIERNWMDTLGLNMKQTSCYFRALAPANTIRDNICYTGPRAGVNWNDGFM
jgi:hypothetical protein